MLLIRNLARLSSQSGLLALAVFFKFISFGSITAVSTQADVAWQADTTAEPAIPPKVNEILQRIQELESRREAFHVCFEHHRIRFEREILQRQAHSHYGQFADYGDAEAYRDELSRLRSELQTAPGKRRHQDR